MKCSVKIKIEQITCPGTLHLHDRHPVFLNVYLFGRIQRSHPIYPSFPMVFNCKFKFRRIFTNAKTPEQVLEILEDETALVELKQECKRVKGGNVIAQFEEGTRKFLFPSESIIPRADLLKRDVLLSRTHLFNNGKGLDPQLTFRTKTIIEVEPPLFDINTVNPLYLSKKLPYVVYQDQSFVPSTKASAVKTKKRNKNFPKLANVNRNTFSKSVPVTRNDKSKITSSTLNNESSLNKHCVCECPELVATDIEEWVAFYESKLERKQSKPFRTGKEPDNLISRRKFETAKNNSISPEKKLYKGICKDCAVPLKNCVLCNAYKTVYGNEHFLSHRLQRKHSRRSSENSHQSSPDKKMEPLELEKTISQQISGNPDALFENLPMSTPFPEKQKPRKYIQPTELSTGSLIEDPFTEDEGMANNSEEYLRNRQIEEIISSRQQEPLFQSRSRHYRTVNATEKESFAFESEKIHNRIKNLMKKNESVLQYELSSSGSESDDEDSGNDILTNRSISRLSLEDPPKSTSSRRSLPSRSVVVPAGESPYWRVGQEEYSHNMRSRRDVFDSSLRARYKDLYEETQKSYKR